MRHSGTEITQLPGDNAGLIVGSLLGSHGPLQSITVAAQLFQSIAVFSSATVQVLVPQKPLPLVDIHI